jgi:hypothetical protein
MFHTAAALLLLMAPLDPEKAFDSCLLQFLQLQLAPQEEDQWIWFCMRRRGLTFQCSFTTDNIYSVDCWGN